MTFRKCHVKNSFPMKKIKCQVCGSSDIVKQDGDVFVCQSCGVKYTAQNIKDMVEQVGTSTSEEEVKNPKEIQNLLVLAHRCLGENIPKARDYYEEVLRMDPDNEEAIKYSLFCENPIPRLDWIPLFKDKITNAEDQADFLALGMAELIKRQQTKEPDVMELVNFLVFVYAMRPDSLELVEQLKRKIPHSEKLCNVVLGLNPGYKPELGFPNDYNIKDLLGPADFKYMSEHHFGLGVVIALIMCSASAMPPSFIEKIANIAENLSDQEKLILDIAKTIKMREGSRVFEDDTYRYLLEGILNNKCLTSQQRSYIVSRFLSEAFYYIIDWIKEVNGPNRDYENLIRNKWEGFNYYFTKAVALGLSETDIQVIKSSPLLEQGTDFLYKDKFIKLVKTALPPDCEEYKKLNKGCYVATSVYGSYDCPEVWTLRRYRDSSLAQSVAGRCFIKSYYAISPTVVKLLGKKEWFNNLWRPILDRFVKSLQKSGYESTPYQD